MWRLGGVFFSNRAWLLASFVLLTSTQAQAQLTTVGPVDPANGFPLFYGDSRGLSLQLCLSQTGFCFVAPPDPNLPISFPGNFGEESFYFRVIASLTVPGGGQAFLVYALEGGFLNAAVTPGDQIVFGRLRIRVDTPQGGTYKVIHPFGQDTFTSVAAGRRAINFTVDVGRAVALDFQAALHSRIGPFLVSTKGQVADALGEAYLANPATPTTVTGSPFGTNFFRIEGPGIGGPGVDFLQTDQFTLMGKIMTPQPLPGPIAGPPAANDDVGTTSQNQPVILDVLANDLPGPNGNPIAPSTLQIVSAPLNGDAVVNPADGTVTYTPKPDFFGIDNFTYILRDTGNLFSNLATVTVTTLSPPVAGDDMVTTLKNTPVLMDILENDVSGSGGLSLDRATVKIIDLPSNGDAAVNPSDGKVTYTPHLDFLGTDTFTYVVQDTGKATSNLATVTLTVKKPPISELDLGLDAVGPIDSATGFPLWYQDRKGVALEHCLSPSALCLANEPSLNGFTSPGSSALYFLASASLDLPSGGQALLVLALESGFLNDSSGLGTEVSFARVRIQMDIPKSGMYKVIHPFGEDTFTSIAGARPAVNLTEDAGGAAPGNFSLALRGRIGPFLSSTEGPVTDALGDSYLADPSRLTTITGSLFDTNFFRIEGPDIGGPGVDFIETDQFTLMGKILGARPVAVTDGATTAEEKPVVIDVAGNDLPGFGGNSVDPTTVEVVDAPSNGAADVNPADGTITYTPKALFYGTDAFSYVVRDTTSALSNTATVTITVTFVNHLPVAADDNVDIKVSEPMEINVLANDTDPDNNIIPGSVSIVTPPQFGTAVVNGNGVVTYISTPEIARADSLTYNIRDAGGAVSNNATVLMTPIQKPFIRCDANADKIVDISDGASVLNYLFAGRAGRVACLDALDADDNGIVNLTDAVFILMYLFQGGSYPPAPFPEAGIDSTDEDPYFCH